VDWRARHRGERLPAYRRADRLAACAADIMTVCSLTTMRLFKPYELSPWPNILAYLKRIGMRPAHRRAMQKADPDLIPVLGAVPMRCTRHPRETRGVAFRPSPSQYRASCIAKNGCDIKRLPSFH
jgi:hypothetical protein